jgi:hypothetical protein
MRIWTVHPRYLDALGLVALWREGLLARRVLAGRTRGYRHHPQLVRFRACADPLASIDAYLREVWREAGRRGYRFDRAKLGRRRDAARIPETVGQLELEWSHLQRKLRVRDPSRGKEMQCAARPVAHPLFRIVAGRARAWERARPQPLPSHRISSRPVPSPDSRKAGLAR